MYVPFQGLEHRLIVARRVGTVTSGPPVKFLFMRNGASLKHQTITAVLGWFAWSSYNYWR